MRIQINFQRLCSLLLFLLPALIFGQGGYLDYTQMSTKLKELAKKPNTKLESYGKSHSNKDLWVLKLGNNTNPAILIVAGVDGRHQAGSLAAATIAEKFLSVDSLSNLLSTKTVYIIPNANPDAMDAFFAKTKFEKSGNARPTDDNRNGRIADDVYNDLNGDGVITMVRVETQAGDHVKSDKDGRLMIKADAAKDQKGTHSIITEGIDDNKNGIILENMYKYNGKFNIDLNSCINILFNVIYEISKLHNRFFFNNSLELIKCMKSLKRID